MKDDQIKFGITDKLSRVQLLVEKQEPCGATYGAILSTRGTIRSKTLYLGKLRGGPSPAPPRTPSSLLPCVPSCVRQEKRCPVGNGFRNSFSAPQPRVGSKRKLITREKRVHGDEHLGYACSHRIVITGR